MKRRIRSTLLFVSLAASLGGCSDDPPADAEIVDSVSLSVVTECPYLDPASVPPLPTPVKFDHELVIRDLSVVEDPCRTTWAPKVACDPNAVGIWTFGFLMSRMAGSQTPSAFVARWLSTFETPQMVNGSAIPARTGIRQQLIDPWLKTSGCPAGAPLVGVGSCALDLKKAPFRLLAIVNRIDLAGTNFGATEPGEGRFVFGAVNPATGAPHSATVILEYKLPSFRDALDWALVWHELSEHPIGSPEYLDALSIITDEFTMRFAEPGNPNQGSSIGQVRTNEIQYGPGWKLREYTLQDAGLGPDQFRLLPTTTKQTPRDNLNGSAQLDAWLVNNQQAILDLSHQVPNNLLAGETTASFAWKNGGSAGPIAPMTRHLFGFSTCNGCHSQETGASFLHIGPRAAGQMASLSGFLGASAAPGQTPGRPASFHTFKDPVSGTNLHNNEPWRRVCEATRILNGDPDPWTNGSGAH
jgi:hypothetical protein